jgi:hypothetical protein
MKMIIVVFVEVRVKRGKHGKMTLPIQQSSSNTDSPRNSLANHPIVEATRVAGNLSASSVPTVEATRVTGNFLASTVPTAVATPINVRRVSPTDVESQAHLPATDVIEGEVHDEETALGSKTLSIALFFIILAGPISSFFMPGIAIQLEIIAIVIASVLRNGSVYTSSNRTRSMNLTKRWRIDVKPHEKKWATATLVTMVFVVILRASYMEMTQDTSNPFRVSSRVLMSYGIAYYCLITLALIFSGCIACDRRNRQYRQRSTY